MFSPLASAGFFVFVPRINPPRPTTTAAATVQTTAKFPSERAEAVGAGSTVSVVTVVPRFSVETVLPQSLQIVFLNVVVVVVFVITVSVVSVVYLLV